MDNSITEKSPAKINLFLKILNRREDNYHNIRTGITSINLCDEIEVKPSNQFNVEYRGAFAPDNNIFDDCIIKKIFSFLNIHLNLSKVKLTIYTRKMMRKSLYFFLLLVQMSGICYI